MEKLIKELLAVLNEIEQAHKELKELKKGQQSLADEIEKLKKRNEQVSFEPVWVPTKKALELLDIKKPHTLKNYADMGLIEFRRGYDKRNYYKVSDLEKLPEKLFELNDKKI